MEFVIFLVALAFVVIAIVGAVAQVRERRSRTHELMAISDFASAIKIASCDGSTGLGIDPQRNKLAITRPGRPPKLFSFSDIIAVEVFRDDQCVTKTNRGSQAAGAAIGAVFLGPVGLLLGGLSGSN